MADTMSNLERYLRYSQGINFFARRDMLAAYASETGAAVLPALVEKANSNGQLTEEAYADNRKRARQRKKGAWKASCVNHVQRVPSAPRGIRA